MFRIAPQFRRSLSRFSFDNRMLLGSCAAAMLVGASLGAHAQDASTGSGPEEVTVSASRISASGFEAPTPTTVVGSKDIEQSAQPNLYTTITQLPALTGSAGTINTQFGPSSGQIGVSSLSLHNLGSIRTLTLIDGQRVVPANVTGVADITEFPQLLIQRVDIVTGGASASWGSDAVGGVVNFVTVKDLDGVKANVQGGISKYGDEGQGLFQLAAGTSLFGGKGHIEASAEFFRNDGVANPNTPGSGTAPAELAGNRCCNYNRGQLAYTTTTTPAGVPQITPIINAQPNTSAEYGLITSVSPNSTAAAAALVGKAFNPDGSLSPFQFGSPCVGTICQGGDLTNTTQKTSVESAITRGDFYARLSYDVAPGIEVYGTVNYASAYTFNYIGSTIATGVQIFCGNAPGGPNAYLSAAVNAACVSNNVTSFKIGVPWDIEPIIKLSNQRTQRRFVAGVDGTFNMFGTDWLFNSYAEHGENDTSVKFGQQINLPHWNKAIDAVTGPNGTIICRANAVTITAPGCVPFALFGNQPMSTAAINYVAPPPSNGPFSITGERQEAASFSINGTPIKDWAGDVALAFGAEYREEAYNTRADPYADGVTTINPNTAAYPADPTLDPTGNNWRSGNYHSGHGNYHVEEAFVELGIPLINDIAWGKADLNLAGRATDYSTSGYVSTWKVGATWDTPLTGVRLRALQSRDVRAPNLSELFAAPVTSNTFVNDRTLAATAPQVQVQQRAIGNSNLKPETAQSTEVGAIYQPDFLPGFSLSVDYYRVAVKQEIGSLSAQQVVDLCQVSGNANYCPLFFLKGTPGTANQSFVITQPFNLAQNTAEGIDFEASYQFDLQQWGVPGTFDLRGLAAHVDKFFTNTGVPGAAVTETAGATDPLWKLNLSQTWNVGPVSFNLIERYFSNGVLNPYGIVCQPGTCPAPTIQTPTYSFMKTPGYLFVDLGGSYQITDSAQAYFKINNFANNLPGPVVGGVFSNSPGAYVGGTGFADPIGRTYSIGVRFSN